MKKFSKINESESNEPIKMTIEIEFSQETADALKGYYDTTDCKDAVISHLQELHELDGVNISIKEV